MSDPGHTVRASPKLLDALMEVTGQDNKSAAMHVAFHFTLQHYDDSSILSKMSKMSKTGQTLPKYITPSEAVKIFAECGIEISAKTIKRYCKNPNHPIRGNKLGPPHSNSPWAVNLESVIDFLTNPKIMKSPDVIELN